MSVAVGYFMADLSSPRHGTQPPDDRAVAKVVDTYFASQPGYQKGDLITRSQIEKVVAKLADAMAGRFPIRAQIVETWVGRRFVSGARAVDARRAEVHAEDRAASGALFTLDRLSTIPRGQTLVRDLIRQKDGDKMIEYLATTKGGKTWAA